MKQSLLRCSILAGCAFSVTPVLADVWVFEPSITLDQRFDDNYFLEPSGDGELSATRAVGELGLSRESEAANIKGLVRVDALLTTQSDSGEEGLESNQLIAFDAKRRSARSRYGVFVSFKQDTPSRDIAADISDPESLASDTGLNPTQTSNVARQEITVQPQFNFNITRRLEFTSKAVLTFVEHELPDAQDVIYQRYLDENRNSTEPLLPYDQVTSEDLNGFFSPDNELDDFNENEIQLGLRYAYSPISTLSATLSYSEFNADVLVDALANNVDDQLVSDPDNSIIRRKPRRDSFSSTVSLSIGFEKYLTPTLQFGISAGVYENTQDLTDTLRPEDREDGIIPADRLAALESDSDGWLAGLSLVHDAGLTRYAAKFSVDVQPSSSGTQVETQELTGDVFRTLSPRLNVSLRTRAYEPDRLGANVEDEFARRFISIEPKVEWKYARNWTASAAYRYRRQKARIDPVSAESNAILLSVKYTPPSKIRDAANANGL